MQVDDLSGRANLLDQQYRDKMNELRRFTDMTHDLESGCDHTRSELARAEGDLQVKNEVAVRMKAKIDELVVDMERVNALSEAKTRELEEAKANALALGSKHSSLEAEYQIRSAEASKWQVTQHDSTITQCRSGMIKGSHEQSGVSVTGSKRIMG